MVDLSTGLAVLAVVLLLAALLAIAAGELAVAGVSFLVLTFTIYLRETRV